MESGSSPTTIDAIARRAEEAGYEATIFADAGASFIHLAGDNSPDLAGQLAALPGVARVVPAREAIPPVTSTLRIAGIRPLVPPEILMERLPLPAAGAVTVQRTRAETSRILRGEDDRLIVVVGPCSIHDPRAALEYARRLAPLAAELAADLRLIMRVYFEKPRTTVGWKGLINDPHLDGSFAVNEGLHLARRLLLDVIALGLPAGCEFLDPITPQFIADAVTWGAIGARTTESQVHRNLASGLSMPVGFKNGTGGDVQIAIDAMHAASYPHQFMSVTEQGLAAIVATRGNRDTHLNSNKDERRQPVVAQAVAAQVAAGESGIIGVMLESFLVGGRQDLADPARLAFGQSITDACIGWDTTVPILRDLASAVRLRRTRTTRTESPAG
jgi:3-deoxy-7-phosphoheptulonate synthase